MTSQVKYLGNLRTQMTHSASGSVITTDAPLDNKGQGAHFSPTDIMASALASCMMTIIGIAAAEHGFSIEGSEAQVEKIMQSGPRKVARINILLSVKGQNAYSEKERKIIQKAAETCPVALSLHPDIIQHIDIRWPA